MNPGPNPTLKPEMKEIIFGLDCVTAALSSYRRKIFKLLLYQNDLGGPIKFEKSVKIQEIFEMALKRKISVQFTTRKELDVLLEDRPHQVLINNVLNHHTI